LYRRGGGIFGYLAQKQDKVAIRKKKILFRYYAHRNSEGMEQLPENSYVRVLEMLTKAMNLWANKSVEMTTEHLQIIQEGKRIFKFIIPEDEKYDPQLLKEIYAGQLKAMQSA